MGENDTLSFSKVVMSHFPRKGKWDIGRVNFNAATHNVHEAKFVLRNDLNGKCFQMLYASNCKMSKPSVKPSGQVIVLNLNHGTDKQVLLSQCFRVSKRRSSNTLPNLSV